jgi:hypothetical protein
VRKWLKVLFSNVIPLVEKGNVNVHKEKNMALSYMLQWGSRARRFSDMWARRRTKD